MATSRSGALGRLLSMHAHDTFTVYASPIGPLTLTAGETGLTGVWFAGRGPAHLETAHDPTAFAATITQLEEYFAGARRDFDLPLAAPGTAFQQAVWAHLRTVPYATTTTYGAIAQRLSAERGGWVSPRAVGAANGANPISIIVPCHRVIGATGSLTGYAGGLPAKQHLLAHETRVTTGQLALSALSA